jgi:lysophospholipase L1-like esterase
VSVSGSSRRWTWWAKFVAIQAIVVLLLLEIALRIYNPVPIRVRGNEIVLPVKQVYTFDNGFTHKIDRTTVHTKNSLGFRGPDPPANFASRLTIVTIGGSTTESLFLSDGHTWTDAMTRRLDPEFPGVWVNNAGLDGHTTFGHLILLKSFIVRLHPKVALFLVGANDVGLDQPRTFDEGVLPTAGGFRYAANAIAARSELVSILWNVMRAGRARARGLGHSEIDLTTVEHRGVAPDVLEETEREYRQYLPGYAQRLEQIAELTRANGITAVWITQPALFGDSIDPTTGVDLAMAKVNGRGNGHLEWRLLEMNNDVLRRVAAERNMPLIDLARELPKDSRYFYDFLHFTNEGSEKVGEIVARELVPVLKSLRQ